MIIITVTNYLSYAKLGHTKPKSVVQLHLSSYLEPPLNAKLFQGCICRGFYTFFSIRHMISLIQPHCDRLHFCFDRRHCHDVGYTTATVNFSPLGCRCQNESVVDQILLNKPYPVSNEKGVKTGP